MKNKFRYRIEWFNGFQYHKLKEIEKGVLELNWDYDILSSDSFTWLKDKNWKEIYKNDLINIWEWKNQKVYYENWAYRFWDDWFQIWSYLPIVIIGNIYENSDLINK